MQQRLAIQAMNWTPERSALAALTATTPRRILKRAKFVAAALIVDVESGDDEAWRKAMALRGVLDEGDTMAGYEEETTDPVTVLGVEASYTTVVSTSGFVATGLVMAAQGWFGLIRDGWGYHQQNAHGVEWAFSR